MPFAAVGAIVLLVVAPIFACMTYLRVQKPSDTPLPVADVHEEVIPIDTPQEGIPNGSNP